MSRILIFEFLEFHCNQRIVVFSFLHRCKNSAKSLSLFIDYNSCVIDKRSTHHSDTLILWTSSIQFFRLDKKETRSGRNEGRSVHHTDNLRNNRNCGLMLFFEYFKNLESFSSLKKLLEKFFHNFKIFEVLKNFQKFPKTIKK